MDLARLIEMLRQEIPGLVAIYRFGSWGTPYQRNDSDLDIAVLQAAPLGAAQSSFARLNGERRDIL